MLTATFLGKSFIIALIDGVATERWKRWCASVTRGSTSVRSIRSAAGAKKVYTVNRRLFARSIERQVRFLRIILLVTNGEYSSS
jgi:hypothetical protein